MKVSFLKIGAAVLLITAMAMVSLGCIGYRKVEKTVKMIQPIDKEEVKEMVNPNIPEEIVTSTLKDNWTVALFGIDARDMSDLSSSNSDVIIIASVNNKTGEIKMASVYRDTCLKTGKSRYRKVNEAYGIGGPKKAIEVLNENLDLQIDDYVAVNWAAVAQAINILGGVDVEITDKEFFYINSYITETVNSTGIGSTHLEHAGMNHLDGVQAVAYCRIRYSDSDFKRTERQRLVLSLMLEKAKAADWATINNVIETVFPMTASSIDTSNILYLGKNIFNYKLTETIGFPFEHKEKRVEKLDYVFPDKLANNVSKLHEFLYGTEEYDPSDAVKKISEAIEQKASVTYKKQEPEPIVLDTAAVSETESPETEAPVTGETEPETVETMDYIHYGPGYVPVTDEMEQEIMESETQEEQEIETVESIQE